MPERRAYTFLANGRDEGRVLTYGLLSRLAGRCAWRLREQVEPGDRVLVLHENSLDFLIGFMGCIVAGAVAVPVPPLDTSRLKRTLPRLQSVVTDCDAAAVLASAAICDELDSVAAEGAPEGVRRITLDHLDEGPIFESVPVAGDDLALLQYTSGSTSAPKGVMVTHANLLDNLARLQRAFEYGPESTTVTWMPYFHDYGLIDGLLEPLFAAASAYVISPVAFVKRPWTWLEAVSRYRATHIHGPNFAYEMCVERGVERVSSTLDLSSLVVAACAAEPVRESTAQRFIAAYRPYGFRPEAFSPAYGMAEATLVVSATPNGVPHRTRYLAAEALQAGRCVEVPPSTPRARPVVSCGAPAGEALLRIVDPETGRELPDDTVGELWLANASVASGYWKQPEESALTFGARTASGAGPMLRTGDLAFTHGGELYITGRLKDVVIVHGQNHYPQDIELSVEGADPAIRPTCVAAFSIEGEEGERLVIAAELGRPDVESEAVFAAIRSAVSEQHQLACSAIVLLPKGSIPKTSSGKIQRRACRTAYLAGAFTPLAEWKAPEPARPAAETPAAGDGTAAWERWLRRLLAERRRIPEAAVDSSVPFSSFGLSSLEAVEIAASIEARTQRDIPVTALWEYPSIRSFAEFLASRDPLVPVLPAGATGEGIAVIGMACDFPGGSDSPEAFWASLLGGKGAITAPPPGRFPGRGTPLPGGYLADIFRFDAEFFGVSDAEARSLDPQQRRFLETAWHALEDAGILPGSLAGSQTGVFVGVSATDYAQHVYGAAGAPDRHAAIGTSAAVIANRLSYVLDLRGPSLTVDTACSASLVALHQACRALAAGDCDLAIAGGVNALLSAQTSAGLGDAQMLSPSGACRPFDAEADGYVRGEGFGAVVLKRLSAARAGGDRVLAIVRGSAVVQDGRSNGLSAPNGSAQRQAIRAALARAGLEPGRVEYVEAHGTGTPLGDPIELHALADCYGRSGTAACHVGAVKGSIGHLEGAAGIAGFIKAVLVLRHEMIPPNAGLRRANPRAEIGGTRLRLPLEPVPWSAREEARIAAVSSFGFGGTLAHVILSDDPEGRDAAGRPPLPLHPFGGERYRIDAAPRSPLAEALAAGRRAEMSRQIIERRPELAEAALRLEDWLEAVLDVQRRQLEGSSAATPQRYLTEWSAVELPVSPRRPEAPGRICLLLGTEGPAAAWIGAALDRRPELQRVASLRDLPAGCAPLIVYCGFARPGEGPDDAALRLTEGLLETVRLAAGWPGARLWAVTQGAMPVAPADAVELAGAGLWGAGKSAALELPELWGGLADLPAGFGEAEADRFAEAVLAGSGEDQLAWRDGGWLAPRLALAPPAGGTPQPLRGDAVYWVAGGSGALGKHAVAYLLEHGARHVVVSGRGAEPPAPTNGSALRYIRADVRSLEDGARVLAAIDASGLPLAGVIHAAGTASLMPIGDVSAEEFRAVAESRMTGGWNLHRLTADRPLELFVCFSSISGLWGGVGQAHYAAANHFLDLLCEHRRRRALPGLAVAWGPWAGGGMVSPELAARLAKIGLETLEPEAALALLAASLRSGEARVAAAAVRWEAFGPAFTARRPSAFLSRFVQSPALEPSARVAPPPELDGAPFETVKLRVREHLCLLVGEQLGTGRRPSLDRGLFDLGLDSLAVVALRNRLAADLGVAVATTELFSYPTIEALAGRVAQLLRPGPDEASAAPELAGETLSGRELARLIALEFDALGRPSGDVTGMHRV